MTTPYYADPSVTVYAGDCLDVLRDLPDASVDAVVTDPPYSLSFMGRTWDSHENPAAFQQWCQLWAAECLRVLKPGGHLLAFGGTRTWHRLACAVEDAGFEIRDSIAWLYGSGFPKSLDVSKAIDKRPGVARHAEFADQMYGRRLLLGYSRADVSEAVVGTRSGACWNWEHHQFPEVKWWPKLKAFLHMEDKWDAVIADAERARVGTRTTGRGTGGGATPVIGDSGNYDITAPATDAARQWQGWGTALKPGHEPIVVARKPLIGTVAANVQAWGTGALNIDGCRIGERVETWPISRGPNTRNSMAGGVMAQTETGSAPAGRWPANVTLDENQAAALDQQSGTLTSGLVQPHHADAGKDDGIYGAMPGGGGRSSFGDTGGASRFFYTAKADAGERIKLDGIAHPTVKPLSLMRWLVRLVCPPGGVVLEPFAGSGTTVEACILEGFRCIAIEREADYLPLITQRINRRRDPVAAVLAGGEDAGLFDLLGDLEVLEELGEETA